MKRLAKHILLLFFCTASPALYGQGYFHTRTLLDSASLKNKTIIILKETDSFIIAAPLTAFTDNLEQVIKENNSKKDKELLSLFSKNKPGIIHADSVLKIDIHKTKLFSAMARLLQNGHCLVYSKLNRQTEKTITIEKYNLGNSKGRRFKSKGGYLLLTTVD